MAAITLVGVRKRYGSTTALDELHLDVCDGEFFCLLGPSGAGKTTTLKIIAGLEEPDEGSVTVDGTDVGDVEPTHRGLAMCFESYALYPHLDVFGNLVSPLRSPRFRTDRGSAQARVRQVADLLGIAHLFDRRVTQLSNGQRQRVALGRVLVRPATAYLLDEPLAHLDAKLRAAMRSELKTISRVDGTSTVYVTHDYVEALSLADRIGVLHKGRLLQVGRPREIWDEPANAFVALAFGKPRLSLIPAEVVDAAGGRRVRSRDGGVDLALPHVQAPAGTAVQVGLRPRDLRLIAPDTDQPSAGCEAITMDGRVYVLEHLGRQTEVTVQIRDDNLVSVLAPRTEVGALAPDDPVRLLVDRRSVKVFAAGELGARIVT